MVKFLRGVQPSRISNTVADSLARGPPQTIAMEIAVVIVRLVLCVSPSDV